jgi:arylsulfatase A-like enzyme
MTTFCGLPRSEYNFTDINSTAILFQHMQYAANHRETPFFLAIGLHKPHMAWRFPEEFLRYYPNPHNLSVAIHRHIPEGMPPVAFHMGIGPHHYTDLKNSTYNISVPFPAEIQQHLRQGYYSAVSYMDSLVGEALEELDRLNLSENTIVAFHADHGWQLGEHNLWAKHTNFELAARVPFMIRVPWKTNSMGKTTSAIVELVDVYPTLVELAGLPPSHENLEGDSLVPLFENPTTTVKLVALSQYPRCRNIHMEAYGGFDPCTSTKRTDFDYMGYSMRTEQYRYTEWVKWNGSALAGEWSDVLGRELYNHTGDGENNFDAFENVNIADTEKELVDQLSKLLHALFSDNSG